MSHVVACVGLHPKPCTLTGPPATPYSCSRTAAWINLTSADDHAGHLHGALTEAQVLISSY